MTDAERLALAIQRLRGLAERHRRKAEIHTALGALEEASNCQVLAELQEERARNLERRATDSG